jgi:hypothetical protein
MSVRGAVLEASARALQPPLRAWSVIGRTLAAWIRHLPILVLLSAAATSPFLVFTVLVAFGPHTAEALQAWDLARSFAAPALAFLASGSVVYAVALRAQGRPVRLAPCVEVGARRVLDVAAVGLLALVAVCLAAAPYFLLLWFGSLRRLPPAALLALPVWVVCVLWVAVPAAVAEATGPVAALRRSAVLTSRARSRIFGVLAFFALATAAAEAALAGAVAPGVDALAFDAARAASADAGAVRAHLLSAAGLDVLIGSWGVVASAIAYHDLRTKKEGASVEGIASVFD